MNLFGSAVALVGLDSMKSHLRCKAAVQPCSFHEVDRQPQAPVAALIHVQAWNEGAARLWPWPVLVFVPDAGPTTTSARSAAELHTGRLDGGDTPRGYSDVNVEVGAHDNVGIVEVIFYAWVCNGADSDTEEPYTTNFTFCGSEGQRYDLEARAYDAAGNSASISITVYEDG